MNIRKTLTLGLAGVLFCLLSAPVSAWAQVGTVRGKVTNVRTGNAVETAQVYLVGTRIGTLSDLNGNFSLPNVPAGEYTLRAEIIGYKTVDQIVNVVGGETQVVEFQLVPGVLQLQELIVTGTAARLPRAKLPFSVEHLDVADMPVPATSAERAIQGKGAGVHVVKGSGQPGDAADIMLRAPISITRGQGPLIIIDGVLAWNTMADIDALDIESIEIVKGAAAASLYGSTAATGVIQITTRRGAGLQAGESQVTSRVEYGIQALEGDFPFVQQHPYMLSADGTQYVDVDGNPIDSDSDGEPDGNYGPGVELDALWSGVDPTTVTFQDKDYPGATFDHLDRFFDPNDFLSVNASVTGKTANTNYRASFTNLREKGIILFHDGYTRRNARLNIDHQVWPNLTLSLSGYYAWAHQDETTTNNPLFDLTFMPPNVDLLARECIDPEGLAPDDPNCLKTDLIVTPDPLNIEETNPLYTQFHRTSEDRNSRVLGSLFARYSPTTWLDIEANFGLDRSDFHQFLWTPKGIRQSADPTPEEGALFRYNDLSQNINAGLTAAFHQQFGDVIARGQASYQFEDRHFETFEAEAGLLGAEDVPALQLGDPSTRDIESEVRDINSNFFYLAGAADYKGKYILDGLVRWDGSSLFGPEERWSTYYRGSVAWRPSQEPWWFVPQVGEFKLRFSYGTAGNRPAFANQYETYDVAGGIIRPENLGNRALKPEFVREMEYGAEFLAFDRFNFIVSYSDVKTEDALLFVPQPGFVGFTNQWQNAAEIEGNTWELSLEAALAETQDLTWTARVSWDRSRNEMTKVDVPPYRQGWNDEQFIRAGESLGTFFGNRWATSCDELHPDAQEFCLTEFQVNDDGYLVWVGDGNSFRDGLANQLWGSTGDVGGQAYDWGLPIKGLGCERRLADGNLLSLPASACEEELPANATAQQFSDFLRIGDSQPDFAWSMSTNLRWKQFTLYGLLDAEIGQDVYWQTGQWSMRELKSGEVDQAGKPDELKKPIGYYSQLYNVNEINSYYVRDGTYLKIRELSLGYTFNRDQLQSVLPFLGLQNATIRLIGRNLLTFTDFPGYDPETGFSGQEFGGSAVIGRTDAYRYPNFRTITAMVDVTF